MESLGEPKGAHYRAQTRHILSVLGSGVLICGSHDSIHLFITAATSTTYHV